MFEHNINPVLVSWGFLEIRYYGIIYALGFVFALWYLLQRSRQGKLSLTEEEIYDFMVYLVVGVVLGARLFEVAFYHPDYYFLNPGQIFAVWNGGLSFHGGFVGGVFALVLFLRKRKHDFYEVADALMVPLALGLAFGRLANFINGELYGRVTTMPWGVKFPGADGFRHPTQIYESLKNFLIFGTLFSIRDRKFKKGFLFWGFITLYGILRLVIEFWKEPETIFLGIPMGQLMSGIMILTGGYVLYSKYLKK
ncbi:prolipoprotein diacylglyceryl transferase [Candidatus Woesearchaeota archaeon]|nr:prolipoprotein diacylglyceryl transferase [Candidatus Woesearchaeota archaeon]